jgi:hypothetical protein
MVSEYVEADKTSNCYTIMKLWSADPPSPSLLSPNYGTMRSASTRITIRWFHTLIILMDTT